MFSTSAVVMVSWVYAYVQTHHDVYLKYVQFFISYTSINVNQHFIYAYRDLPIFFIFFLEILCTSRYISRAVLIS